MPHSKGFQYCPVLYCPLRLRIQSYSYSLKASSELAVNWGVAVLQGRNCLQAAAKFGVGLLELQLALQLWGGDVLQS